MVEHVDMAKTYGGRGSANMAVPLIGIDGNPGEIPHIKWLVIIQDPADAARLATNNVRKTVGYSNTFLRNGVLSTSDDALWTKQRQHVVSAFLPFASLAKIFPISLSRANYAMTKRLPELCGSDFSKPVEILEFWLHEAMAQLQLGPLGESTSYMEENNIPLRAAFTSEFQSRFDPNIKESVRKIREARVTIQKYSFGVVDRARAALAAGKFTGPLASCLADIKEAAGPTKLKLDRDNAATFLFAGHDTTANLMAWFTFEMGRRPELQRRLHAEIDKLYDRVEAADRDLQYVDLQEMTFMTRCITEVLRYWPSVPNGTFRTLTQDEMVRGRGGKQVLVPAGTDVQIAQWSLHNNPELWGPDAHVFNPDRNFLSEELAGGATGANPQSHRYCPFTFNPRSCIGRNFAMMEARVLLSMFFRRFQVELAEPTRSQAATCRERGSFLGKNFATMGPGAMHVKLTPRSGRK